MQRAIVLGLCLTVGTAWAQESPQAGKDVAALIHQLDAAAFADREAAQKALVEIGEAAVGPLKKAVAESNSAELRQRAAATLKKIELALLRKDPVKIADIIALTKDAETGKVDAEKMEALLERLMEILAKDTKTERKLPVRFGEVTPKAERLEREEKKLILLTSGEVAQLKNSIVIASSIARISVAQNCVIVAGIEADVSHAENCVIIAGEQIKVSFDRGSTLLSGGALRLGGSPHQAATVVGAVRYMMVSALGAGKTIYLNRPDLAERAAELYGIDDAPRSVVSTGIVLNIPRRDEPLKHLLTIVELVSGSSGELFFFRRTKTGAEYFTRVGQELRSPEGEPLPELAGWKVEHIDPSFAVLIRDGRRTVLWRPLQSQ